MTEFKYHNQGFAEDRNEKMIEVLQKKEIKGTFLFFLYGKKGEQAPGFITPAGLTDTEASAMCKEFYALFAKYTKKWKERQEQKNEAN